MCQVVIEIEQGKQYMYCENPGDPYCNMHMGDPDIVDPEE